MINNKNNTFNGCGLCMKMNIKQIILALVLLLMTGVAIADEFPPRGTPNTCTLTKNSDGDYFLKVTGPFEKHNFPNVFIGISRQENSSIWIDSVNSQFETSTEINNDDPTIINGLIYGDQVYGVVVNFDHVPCTLHVEKQNPWWQRFIDLPIVKKFLGIWK